MALLTSQFRCSSRLLSFRRSRSSLSGVETSAARTGGGGGGGRTNNSRMDSVLKPVLSSSIAQSDSIPKTIDAHLHVWASPIEAAHGYPYHPGQEPALDGSSQFLLQCMDEAGVDGALIVQPINHMFDHSLVTCVLKKHPTRFAGCCLANPAEDGSGIHQLEHLVLKDGYRAVRFNPYLWPSGQKMTNEVGSALFNKAGELGIPVGIMCMKGLALHLSEIEELCSNFPSTVVILDHLGFCKAPLNSDDEESDNLSALLRLSMFPQIYVKFSALFRLSRKPFPYEDISSLLFKVISSYGSNHIMWGSDFPFVVPECGYIGAKESAYFIASKIQLSTSDLESIMGRTAAQLFRDSWKSQIFPELISLTSFAILGITFLSLGQSATILSLSMATVKDELYRNGPKSDPSPRRNLSSTTPSSSDIPKRSPLGSNYPIPKSDLRNPKSQPAGSEKTQPVEQIFGDGWRIDYLGFGIMEYEGRRRELEGRKEGMKVVVDLIYDSRFLCFFPLSLLYSRRRRLLLR